MNKPFVKHRNSLTKDFFETQFLQIKLALFVLAEYLVIKFLFPSLYQDILFILSLVGDTTNQVINQVLGIAVW